MFVIIVAPINSECNETYFYEVSMVGIGDVKEMYVSEDCAERWPCGHCSRVTLNDGRVKDGLNNFQINSIVSKIGIEKINPGGEWDGNSVRLHFQSYSKPAPDMGRKVESAETVLNTLFGEVVEDKLRAVAEGPCLASSEPMFVKNKRSCLLL
jgi:hypothetical protein